MGERIGFGEVIVKKKAKIGADLIEGLTEFVDALKTGGDGAYLATVPELPGCKADGPTYREALANAEVVIREWIETAMGLGREIPEPRGRLMFA